MGNNEEKYKIAFSFLRKKFSASDLSELIRRGIGPKEFFTLPTKELLSKSGLSHEHEFDKIAREEALALASNEWERIKAHNIKPLFILDEDYPHRLGQTEDPPIVLYKLGEADLDAEYMLSMVGTRKPTPYGIGFCNKFIEELSFYFPESTIVSGLAYGIDASSHKMALEKNLPTVAVVAHGLNMIYPAAHRNLARDIIHAGGAILSEYPFDTQPFRGNFLARNRIVAGLSDVTIVVESDIKGGAMSTANFAFMYNREVLALPGRSSDPLSAGCNLLIRREKAHLVEKVADMIEITGWNPIGVKVAPKERNLFPELEGDYAKIREILKYSSDPVQADVIAYKTMIPPSRLISLLGELEFDGIIIRYPGNRYSLA